MAFKQGLVTINNDPYLYQENSNGNTVSAAMGLDTSGTGAWKLSVLPVPGAGPNLGSGFESMIIDPTSGNITFNPTPGKVIIGDGLGTGKLVVDTLTAYSVVCGGTTNTNQLQSVASVGTAGQVLTSNGAGALPTWQGSGTTVTVTSVNNAASPYTVLSTDYFLSCDVTAGVITVRLPNAPATGRVFIIKDLVGLAATSNITITTVGGAVNIDGATSYVMNTAYQSANVVFNGTSYMVY